MSPLNKRRNRWTVSIAKSINIAMRGFLARRGMKKGDLFPLYRGSGQMALSRSDHHRGAGGVRGYGPWRAGCTDREGGYRRASACRMIPCGVLVDINVFISGLLLVRSPPTQIVTFLQEGRFVELLTLEEQLDGLARVTCYEARASSPCRLLAAFGRMARSESG